MDQRGAWGITQDRGGLVAALAGDPHGVGHVIFGKPARDHAAGTGDRDQVAAREIALDPNGTRGQQALALVERGNRARIDMDRPAYREASTQPRLARGRGALCREQRAVAGLDIACERMIDSAR